MKITFLTTKNTVKNIKTQRTTPHQVSYGTSKLQTESEVNNTETQRVIMTIKINSFVFIGVTPATKHSISSGKKGNKNIKNNVFTAKFITFKKSP